MAWPHAPKSMLTCGTRFGLFIASTQWHARPWVTQIPHKHCSTLRAQHHRPCKAHIIQPATRWVFPHRNWIILPHQAEGPKRLDSNSLILSLFFFFLFFKDTYSNLNKKQSENCMQMFWMSLYCSTLVCTYILQPLKTKRNKSLVSLSKFRRKPGRFQMVMTTISCGSLNKQNISNI